MSHRGLEKKKSRPGAHTTLKVTITVTSAGKASGSVRKPPSATGLCNPDYPVRFTAKRR